MTPTPRERVEKALIEGRLHGDVCEYSHYFIETMENVVLSAISDQTAALQAALEDLAKAKQERDGLAAALAKAIVQLDMLTSFIGWLPADSQTMRSRHEELLASLNDPSAILAAHDRAVAARVLRQTANGYLRDAVCDWHTTHITVGKELVLIAAQYEAGEREVPNV